ncbi:hypothetical protein [Latilactobacillus fuchuensis]|uniref:Uncharacterized protein n=1 Tax=Latilactobacillus fuchuensis DSM 14340 = JCM 11249 TaxID=1423747 RepID=A0A0R1RT12_9LACO|nr:hypothetical protein [Latilactobacillus fuchuensis]KRL59625.1 hypothetical protein FC69_GL001585 [Latilactobacillus fuchuensis DSM 14340 = JCM 11249]
MQKFELKALLAAIILVVLVRTLIKWWSPTLFTDGNFLILFIVPVLFILILINLGRLIYRVVVSHR